MKTMLNILRRQSQNRALLAGIALWAALAVPAFSQGITITQVSTDALLARQTTRLYLSAPALRASGAIDAAAFELWESADQQNWESRLILSLSVNPNADEGISFFLLLDNSGSMWDDQAGQPTDDPLATRAAAAKQAAQDFLAALSDKDRAGLAVFNTRYWNAQAAGSEARAVAPVLAEIQKPASEDAYTELYLSMQRALAGFAVEQGRRVLIVLSDGENWPYALKTGKPNPDSGSLSASPAEVMEEAARDGVTIYAIRFGPARDPLIGQIAEDSGGRVFDAMDGTELAAVYQTIRQDVLAEIAIDYRAGMMAGEKRYVRVAASGTDASGGYAKKIQTQRHYYTGTVLGQGAGNVRLYHLLFALAALLLWLVVVLLKLEKETDRTGVRLLFSPAGTSTKFFEIAGPQTVIGAAPDADVSIAGNPSLKASHATIMFDEKENVYTVVADSPVTVNNREVSRKRLESGDVINMAGTVVVFDQALADAARKPKRISAKKAAKNPPTGPKTKR